MEIKFEYKLVTMLVLLFVAIAVAVPTLFWYGRISYELAQVLLEGLAIIVTLSILFSAYLSLEAARQKAVSASELASRPDIHWNIMPKGVHPFIEIESEKNQAFDFEARLACNGVEQEIHERHLEESSHETPRKYVIPLGDYFSKALGQTQSAKITIDITYFSELGGRYHYAYEKLVKREKAGLRFSQRKLARVKLPWFEKPRIFGNGNDEKVFEF
ncbi:MAG TPA: hypothetical protein PLO51_00595 [Candidatus Micrarchaeota archaeon]|nr:hypothetical protein [Candidatus Micrarchaeota archaeon]